MLCELTQLDVCTNGRPERLPEPKPEPAKKPGDKSKPTPAPAVCRPIPLDRLVKRGEKPAQHYVVPECGNEVTVVWRVSAGARLSHTLEPEEVGKLKLGAGWRQARMPVGRFMETFELRLEWDAHQTAKALEAQQKLEAYERKRKAALAPLVGTDLATQFALFEPDSRESIRLTVLTMMKLPESERLDALKRASWVLGEERAALDRQDGMNESFQIGLELLEERLDGLYAKGGMPAIVGAIRQLDVSSKMKTSLEEAKTKSAVQAMLVVLIEALAQKRKVLAPAYAALQAREIPLTAELRRAEVDAKSAEDIAWNAWFKKHFVHLPKIAPRLAFDEYVDGQIQRAKGIARVLGWRKMPFRRTGGQEEFWLRTIHWGRAQLEGDDGRMFVEAMVAFDDTDNWNVEHDTKKPYPIWAVTAYNDCTAKVIQMVMDAPRLTADEMWAFDVRKAYEEVQSDLNEQANQWETCMVAYVMESQDRFAQDMCWNAPIRLMDDDCDQRGWGEGESAFSVPAGDRQKGAMHEKGWRDEREQWDRDRQRRRKAAMDEPGALKVNDTTVMKMAREAVKAAKATV